MKSWFTVEQVDQDTYAISEYQHWEETHCYLLVGEKRCLLVDTGLGVADLAGEVQTLTSKPVVVFATHVHWDHIGGHGSFPAFYVHELEKDWISGRFPLTLAQVKQQLTREACSFPPSFQLEKYRIFQGTPARILQDGDTIDLGGRVLQVCHTPGHSPGHCCLYEEARGDLFTGDLAYQGELLASFPSTDPAAYLDSLKKIARFPVARIFPGHHAFPDSPDLLQHVLQAFSNLQKDGKLRHGTGLFSYHGFQIHL